MSVISFRILKEKILNPVEKIVVIIIIIPNKRGLI